MTLWALCRYKDAPEPDIAGHSVTVKPTAADLAALHQEAEETWTPAFADLIKVGPRSCIRTRLLEVPDAKQES